MSLSGGGPHRRACAVRSYFFNGEKLQEASRRLKREKVFKQTFKNIKRPGFGPRMKKNTFAFSSPFKFDEFVSIWGKYVEFASKDVLDDAAIACKQIAAIEI